VHLDQLVQIIIWRSNLHGTSVTANQILSIFSDSAYKTRIEAIGLQNHQAEHWRPLLHDAYQNLPTCCLTIAIIATKENG
jgi:hypothetical protein